MDGLSFSPGRLSWQSLVCGFVAGLMSWLLVPSWGQPLLAAETEPPPTEVYSLITLGLSPGESLPIVNKITLNDPEVTVTSRASRTSAPPWWSTELWQLPPVAPSHEQFVDYWAPLLLVPSAGETNDTPCHSQIQTLSPRTWLICGPFAADEAQRLLVQYRHENKVGNTDLFFGISTDRRTFQGVSIILPDQRALNQEIWLEPPTTERFWVGWAYQAPSLALTQLELWQYAPPATACRMVDLGNKGVVLPPYDPTKPGNIPMIHADDTVVAERLAAADVHWVRLGFQTHDGILNLADYDRTVDTLCAQGIAVLGLVNQEMLSRQDYASPDEASEASYRTEFAALTGLLAEHFAGRIEHWEIWNEPNLAEGAYLSPSRYAHLLLRTQQAIRRVNPSAQILLGGLASAWADSHEYLRAVYTTLDSELQGARPFDVVAIHPYPRTLEGPDPTVYLFADQAAGYVTILDKFLQTMAEYGDGEKPLWITEIGWNSAQQGASPPWCYTGVLVQEYEQARYLTAAFDILFQQVEHWQQPGNAAIAKVFWYQYMDVGTTDPCRPRVTRSNQQPVDWWFGLYRGDRVTPKPGWCAFAAYPQPCDEWIAGTEADGG